MTNIFYKELAKSWEQQLPFINQFRIKSGALRIGRCSFLPGPSGGIYVEYFEIDEHLRGRGLSKIALQALSDSADTTKTTLYGCAMSYDEERFSDLDLAELYRRFGFTSVEEHCSACSSSETCLVRLPS